MTTHVEIHTRDADTATIDGRIIQRAGFLTIYDAAIAEVQSIALDQGRAVLVKAIDGVGATGVTWMHLHPDGKLDPAEPPRDAEPVPSVVDQPRRRRRAEQSDDDADFYLPVDAPTSNGEHQPQPQQQESGLRAVPDDERPPEETAWAPSWPTPPNNDRPVQVDTHPDVETPVETPAPPASMEQNQAFDTGPIAPQPPTPQQQPPLRSGPVREPYVQQAPNNTGWHAPQAAQQQPFPPQGPPPGAHQQQHWGSPQAPPAPPAAPPSLADLRASRPDAPEAPAITGWRGSLRRLSGGLIKFAPSEEELRLRRARNAVQRSLRGPRTVVIINTKGGGGKTTAVYSLAATFGQARGGYVLGWDNNETRGTLAWRAAPARHTNTAVDLLRDLERFEDPRNARVGDLDNYVRAQGSAQFDVLASDENAASAASIDDAAFRALHRSLSRFYRILVIDTGNNVKAPNWGAAVDLADQIVIVSSIREDTAGGASWTLDHLTEIGHGDKVRNAVTILSAPKAAADPDQRAMQARFRQHFAARTRMVLDVPFDPALVDGDSIVYDALSPATREAWLIAAAAIAEGL